jgi:hypothetical protein
MWILGFARFIGLCRHKMILRSMPINLQTAQAYLHNTMVVLRHQDFLLSLVNQLILLFFQVDNAEHKH